MDKRLYVALVHYPVVDKNGATIASAVTNLDLHDIARTCRTYGVCGYYIITPLNDQQVLINRILDHWTDGVGGTYNPTRCQALKMVRIKTDVDDMIDDISERHQCRPLIVATSAKKGKGRLSYHRLRQMLATPSPVVLVFGTAWGLSDTLLAAVDHVLAPIDGSGQYNHLSVRSAAAIILDRLMGPTHLH